MREYRADKGSLTYLKSKDKKMNKSIKIIAEDLWDEFNETIDDDSFSFSQYALTSVITQENFEKAIEKLILAMEEKKCTDSQ